MTSSLVILFTAALVAFFGSLAAREQKKPIRDKLPKVEGINRAQPRKELALSVAVRRARSSDLSVKFTYVIEQEH